MAGPAESGTPAVPLAAPNLYPCGPYTERLLCCNVLTADEYSKPQVFRHGFYAFSGPVEWPPPHWREGHCQYCAHAFDRMDPDNPKGPRVPCKPVPLPCFHDKRRDEWRITGIFCSWNCAKADLLSVAGLASGGEALLLEDFARSVFGYSGPIIAPAPPRTRLSFFYPGANSLDIDTFRGESSHSFTTIVTPPLLSTPEIYEKHALLRVDQHWCVKGIRAKTPSSTLADSLIKASQSNVLTFGDSREQPCLYQSFVTRKHDTDVSAPDVSAAASNPNSTEGTLLDWRDASSGGGS